MDGMIGEIRIFAGNFAPRTWAFCNGQLLSIVENQELFAILGTTYGGDGRTTFGLPDIRGRAVVHEGTGDGLMNRRLGAKFGSETITMNIMNMPSHTHSATANYLGQADGDNGDLSDPTDAFLASAVNNNGPLNIYDIDHDPDDRFEMGDEAVDFTLMNTGAGLPFDNMQPSLAVNYIICTMGLFPSRN
ncbi:MAG: tail fiber protein [Bacteroidia bacterium]